MNKGFHGRYLPGWYLAVGWQLCLGSLSAKDPGDWEGSECGLGWGSVQPHNVVVSVSGI